MRVLPWIRQSCKNHDGIILLISDSGSSTTTSHNLDDFISMDPTVGIGDVLHLMDFVKKFFRNWFYLEDINWLYILYNGATLLTIYNKCWRWKKNVLTKKKYYFDGYLLYIPKVNYRRRGIFFLKCCLKKYISTTLSSLLPPIEEFQNYC